MKNEKFVSLEKMVKSRLVETLVEEMLQRSGFTVYRFGKENYAKQLDDLIPKNFNLRHIKKFRFRPDFEIIFPDGEKRMLLEVKFRWDNKLNKECEDPSRFRALREHWPGTIVVVVNKIKPPYFRVFKEPYTTIDKDFGEVGLLDSVELGQHISPEIYNMCEEMVFSLFQGLDCQLHNRTCIRT